MQTITLRIPDRHYPGFLKIIEGLEYVQRVEVPADKQMDDEDEDRPPTKEEILEDIRQGLLQIRRAEKTGEEVGQDAWEVLEELKRERA